MTETETLFAALRKFADPDARIGDWEALVRDERRP